MKITKEKNCSQFEALQFVRKVQKQTKADRQSTIIENGILVDKSTIYATDKHRLYFCPISDIPDGIYLCREEKNYFALEFPKEKNEYPDVYSVVNQKQSHKVTIDRANLVRRMRQAKVIANGCYAGIELRFNGSLQIMAVNPDLGDMETQIDTDRSIEPEIRIGMSCEYILSALQAMKSKTVDLSFEGYNYPILFKSEDRNVLIMPMRI